jgi:hypothetical protein
MCVRVCCSHRPDFLRTRCSQYPWNRTPRALCTRCSSLTKAEIEFCDFALELPAIGERLHPSPLLSVSRKLYHESWEWARAKIGLSFSHFDCLLVVLPALTSKQRKMVHYVRYYRTITVQQHEMLKNRGNLPDISSVLGSILTKYSMLPTKTELEVSQDEKYHMTRYNFRL